MKLLHIPSNGFSSNGIISCIMAYMGEIDRRGVDIIILATTPPDQHIVDQFSAMGCSIVSIPCRKQNPVKYFYRLYRYLRASQFDIVHIHGSSALMSIELLAAKCAGCKVRIVHSHNTVCDHTAADRLLRPLFYRLYTNALACGKAAGDWLFPGRPYMVLPNARDLDKYEYTGERRTGRRNELAIPKDSLVVGHVGGFSKQKNHRFLVDVFCEAVKLDDSARLLLVGEGELMPEIQALVGRYGLEDKVIFTGSSNAVERELCAMDMFVLPSLHEGLPLVVIEAQAAGLPCVISDQVTEECMVTNLVSRLPLSAGPAVWAEAVVIAERPDRSRVKEAVKDELRGAGYDIKLSAAWLKKLYQGG